MNRPIENEVIGIAKDEKTLYDTADDLWEAGFSLHDIFIQADPEELQESLGESYPDPNLIADNPNTPRKELVMPEEFGWLLVFSFIVPLFMGMILGSILTSSAYPLYDVILQGLIGGGIVGALIGIAVTISLKLYHDKRIRQQMAKGGFVIWIHVDSLDKLLRAKDILKKDGVSNIHDR
jgi:hypothetical protein